MCVYCFPVRDSNVCLHFHQIKVSYGGEELTAGALGLLPESWLAATVSSSLGETPPQRGEQASAVRMGMSKQHHHL